MIVSLSINLALCFKGNVFIIAYIFVIVKIWASLSDRLFVVGCWYCSCYATLPCGCSHIAIWKINLFCHYAQIFYQWHYSSYFELLLQNLVCVTHCMLLTMRLVVFLVAKLKFVLEVYTAVSRHHVNFLYID